MQSAPDRHRQRAASRPRGVFDVLPACRTLRALSPGTVLDKLRVRAWSTRVAIVVERTVRDPVSAPPGAPELQVTFAPPERCSDMPSWFPAARDGDALMLAAMERTRVAGAGELVVAHEHGRLAGMHFIHTAAHQVALDRVSPQLYASLAADEALTEGVFVVPAFRGRGVASAMLRASCEELAHRGFRRALAVVDRTNDRSLAAFAGAGYRPRGLVRVDAYRLGRRTSRFIGPAAGAGST